MSLSSWDDYPVHQAAEFIAHPATSDRNFYDRYYFNMHPCYGDWFAIFGFGQYPNLGVVDAFIDVRHGRLPARRALVGAPGRPGRPLRRALPHRGARAAAPAAGDRRAHRAQRGHGRHLGGPHPRHRGAAPVHAQQGQGRLRHPAAGPDRDAGRARSRSAASTSPSRPTAAGAPATARGACAPSASPRPTASARASWCSAACGTTSRCSSTTTPSCTSATSATTASGRWCRASGSGSTRTERVEDLGRSEHEHHLIPGTRVIDRSVVRFPEAGLEITCRPLLANFVSIGTGYGIDADWRHGMYHGPDTVTQGLVLDVDEMQGSGPVRHRRPRGRVLLRRPRRLRAARARLLRSLPPLRPASTGRMGAPAGLRRSGRGAGRHAPGMRE